jgi:hypothetical protein
MATTANNQTSRRRASTGAAGTRKPATRKASATARKTKATARKTTATARKTAATARNTTARKTTTTSRRSTRSVSNSTQPKKAVAQVADIAERAILVPVGASLLVGDDVVSTVRGLVTRYRNRAGLERELKRFERRGASARTRLERQVRLQRTRFERDLRQRRSSLERTVKQNRRRFERQVRDARKDFDKQSTLVTNRVERLVADAQGFIG